MREIPIEKYMELAAAIVETEVKYYTQARKDLPKLKARSEKLHQSTRASQETIRTVDFKLSAAERVINEARQFFLSDTFDIYMPSVDGRLFLKALDEKINREMEKKHVI